MKKAICNITVILVVLFLLLFPYPVIAGPAAVLSMSANTGAITGTGGEFDLYVKVANVVNLYAIAFEVSYDNSVLEALKNEKGYYITANSDYYVNPNRLVNINYPFRLDANVCHIYLDAGGNTVWDTPTVGETPVWLGKMRFKVLREAQTELVFTHHTLNSWVPNPVTVPVPIPHIATSLPLIFDFPLLIDTFSPADGVLETPVCNLHAGGSDGVCPESYSFEFSYEGGGWQLISSGEPSWDSINNRWEAAAQWDTGELLPGNYQVRLTINGNDAHTATMERSYLCNVVSGTVSMEGRRYDGVMDGITVQVSGQETVVKADTGGNYELRGVAPGLVDLLFSRNGYLTECKQFNVPADPLAQVPPVILSAGDINGDGSVNKDDYALLKGKYLTADSVIDFDASGLVDLPDMVMLMRNLDLGS